MFRVLLVLLISSLHGQNLDFLLVGGQVIDGTGSAGRSADVGIRGDRIAFLGDVKTAGVKARRTIDVTGLIVCPGFIDPHTHTLEDLTSDKRSNENYLLQGVTTVITGNDGGGPVNTGGVLAKFKQGIGTNAALYVGQGAVRREVMGMSDAAPTAGQLDSMKRLVRASMEAGALGMSSGLFYTPGGYAKTEEVIELAKVAASYGGIYDTHIRDESSYSIGVLGAIREAIDIAKGAGIPLHISHIKVQGPSAWGRSGEVIRMIREAQAQGVEITADQYPYTGSGTSFTAALIPHWAQEGGTAKMITRMDDPTDGPKIRAEMEKNLAIRGGAETMLVTGGRDKALIGMTLPQIAAARNVTPVAAAFAIIHEGGAGIASLNIKEPDIENFMRQDFVVTGSDGSPGHPRKYGTFPRKIRVYVRERGVITLPFFVQHSSALTAKLLRLPERGELKQGYFADVVAFDYNTIVDKSTYEKPEVLSEGVKYVFVNGQLAVENGKYSGALAGKALTRTSGKNK